MKRELGLVVVGALLAVVLLGGVNKAAVFDGLVETTAGGYMFPDQTVQTTAAVTGAGALKTKFYLTDATYTGGLALTACATGYHMGHIWEFRSLDALHYDDSAPGGFNPGGSPGWDLETGPPMKLKGWIRTGTESVGTPNPNWEFTSCAKWTSSAAEHYGQVVDLGLTKDWLSGPPVRFKLGNTETCDSLRHVWCVED